MKQHANEKAINSNSRILWYFQICLFRKCNSTKLSLIRYIHVRVWSRIQTHEPCWVYSLMVTQMVGVLSRCLFEWVCLCCGSSRCAKERTHKHIHEHTANPSMSLFCHQTHIANPSSPHCIINTTNLLSPLCMGCPLHTFKVN